MSILKKTPENRSLRATDARRFDGTHLADCRQCWRMPTTSVATERKSNHEGTKDTKSVSRLHVPTIMWTDAQTQPPSRSKRLLFREKEAKSFCARYRGQLKRHASPRRVSRDQKFFGSFFQKRTACLACLFFRRAPARFLASAQRLSDSLHLRRPLTFPSTRTHWPDTSASVSSRVCMLPLRLRVPRAFVVNLPTPARQTRAYKRHQAWTC